MAVTRIVETKDGVSVELYTDKEKYIEGENIRYGFFLRNDSETDYKVIIDHDGGETTVKIGAKETRDTGYIGSKTAVPPSTRLCFDFSLSEITPQPVISIDKIVWGGVTVWENGKQVAFPVVPVKDGIARYGFGIGYTSTGAYVFKIPEIHISVTEAAYGETCTIYYKNHGIREAEWGTVNCGGEYGAVAVLPQGKTSVVVGEHDTDAEDWCYEPLVCSFDTRWIIGKPGSPGQNWQEVDGKEYSFTLGEDWHALRIVISGGGFGVPVEIYHNGEKIASGATGGSVARYDAILVHGFRAGDEVKVVVDTTQTWWLAVIGTKISWELDRTATHYIYIKNDSYVNQEPIEIRLKVYTCPEEYIDSIVWTLKWFGVNAFKLEPSGVIYD